MILYIKEGRDSLELANCYNIKEKTWWVFLGKVRSKDVFPDVFKWVRCKDYYLLIVFNLRLLGWNT